MNDVFIISLFIVNNIFWGIFVYIFTPTMEKEKISMPKIKVNLPDFHKKEEDQELKDIQDVSEAPSAAKVLESMGVQSE